MGNVTSAVIMVGALGFPAYFLLIKNNIVFASRVPHKRSEILFV